METSTRPTITLGSRPSKLARWQTDYILEQLKKAYPEYTYRVVTLTTEGDKILDRPLPEIGGKGVFTTELETALRAREIDLAVHSLKDLPVADTPGLCVGAVSVRANPQDVLISARREKLNNLPSGARVGTSSLRREAQLKAARPDLEILPLRGNVDTRIRKVLHNEYAAIILAAAGMERLELAPYITEYLSIDIMLPAPGQGALAIQCRADDTGLLNLLHSVHDEGTSRAVTAERAFLAALGAGCSAPVAAYAHATTTGLDLRGLIASVDGQRVIRVRANGDDPTGLGHRLAQQALDQGAGDLL